MGKYFLLLLLLLFISSCKQTGRAYKASQVIEEPLQDTSVLLTPVSSISPTIVTSYIFAGKRIAKFENDNFYYYHDDHLGSHSFITDTNSDMVTEFRNLPFGEAIIGDSKYQYTGKELDKNTQLYYYGARYYDPDVGRFTQVDPIYSTSYSPYAYSFNNPIIMNDPSGMIPVSVFRPGFLLSNPSKYPSSSTALEEPDLNEYLRRHSNFNNAYGNPNSRIGGVLDMKFSPDSIGMKVVDLPLSAALNNKNELNMKMGPWKLGDFSVARRLVDAVRGVEKSGSGDGDSSSLLGGQVANGINTINSIVEKVTKNPVYGHLKIKFPEIANEERNGKSEEGWRTGLIADVKGARANLDLFKTNNGPMNVRTSFGYSRDVQLGQYASGGVSAQIEFTPYLDDDAKFTVSFAGRLR